MKPLDQKGSQQRPSVKGALQAQCENRQGGPVSLHVLLYEEKAASTAFEKVLTKKTCEFCFK